VQFDILIARLSGRLAVLGTEVKRRFAAWAASDPRPVPVFLIGEKAMQPAAVKARISPSELEKVDIRVGTIEKVEDIEGARSLVRLSVDFGDHHRTILAGLKGERQDPSEIEGRQALFVVNLEPRRMMGEMSEGMLLDLGYQDGIDPVLAVPERPLPNGVRAG
jgi:tRNA-binding protein